MRTASTSPAATASPRRSRCVRARSGGGGPPPRLSVTSSRARAALAVGAALLAMLIYAGQFVLSRWSMRRTLSVWDLAALRFTVAGLLSLPIVIQKPPAGAVAWGR